MPEISQNPEAEFELRREALAERLKLKDQWSGQVKILGEVGLLTILPDKHDYGIVGIDGEEYPIPAYGEILKKITPEKLEMLEKKAEQGFKKMLLVPFGLPQYCKQKNLRHTNLQVASSSSVSNIYQVAEIKKPPRKRFGIF